MNYFQKIVVSMTAMSFFIFSGASQAAISASDLATSMAQITTDANTIFSVILPVVIGILALGVGISLLKRFGNKI